MIFASKHEEASFKERLYFDKMIEEYKIFPTDKWSYFKTSYLGYDDYDYSATNKKTGKRLVIEIKVRDRIWDGYVYEIKKHKKLMEIKKSDPSNITILYVNSTPSGTYIWNIDDIIGKYKPVWIYMNKSTMTSRTEKEKKKVYLLNSSDAIKFVPFKYTDKLMYEFERREAEKNKPKSRTRCIFEGLEMDKNNK